MAKARQPERWTEGRVFEMLKGPFPDGAFVRIPQVRNGTGYQRQARTTDALIASCWPSRGLWFAGVEIKVTTGDWKRELAKPGKSAEIQQWCNYWYVAAPAGVVPIGEVPATWGYIECSTRGCKIVKAAPKLKPQPLDVAFVCSILRASTDCLVSKCEVEALANRRATELAKSNAYDVKWLRERIETFQKETGIDIERSWQYGNVSQLLRLLDQSKSTELQSAARLLHCNATRLMALCGKVIELCESSGVCQ